MRNLVKNDYHSAADESDAPASTRLWQRRHIWRRVVAVGCVALAAFYLIQPHGSPDISDSEVVIEAENGTKSTGVVSQVLAAASAMSWQLRHSVPHVVPGGDLGFILKIACCVVAGAVFLRTPREV